MRSRPFVVGGHSYARARPIEHWQASSLITASPFEPWPPMAVGAHKTTRHSDPEWMREQNMAHEGPRLCCLPSRVGRGGEGTIGV